MQQSDTSVQLPLINHVLFENHPAAWKHIAPHIRKKKSDKDDVIIRHGDSAVALWLLIKGWVKLSRQTPDGKETIVGLCTAGDVFGEAALFAQANYPYHAEVLTAETELAAIPADVIRRVIGSDAALSNSIMSLLNERIAQTQLKLEHMNTMSSAQRLGCFLLRLCNQHSESSHTLQIPVEKHLLATFLGMKPETFSRSQQQLKSVGVDVNGSQVSIGNVSKLREFVCNSCSESGSCDSETDC